MSLYDNGEVWLSPEQKMFIREVRQLGSRPHSAIGNMWRGLGWAFAAVVAGVALAAANRALVALSVIGGG